MTKFAIIRPSIILGAVLSISACVAPNASMFPTYPYQGIDLLAGAVGTVSYRDGCYKMQSSSPEGSDFVLVFPQGTRISSEQIVLPRANGGAIPLAATIEVQGGFQDLDEGDYISNPTECSGRAFIVNRMTINE